METNEEPYRPGALNFSAMMGRCIRWVLDSFFHEKNKLFVYLIIPSVINLVFMTMYFSGIPFLQRILFPDLPQLFPNSGREFGLLENTQNIFLILTFVMLISAVKAKEDKWERFVMAAMAVVAMFLFLEEIDYGLPFYEYMARIGPDEAVEVRNFHNVGDRTDIMKWIADAGLAMVFFVLPLIRLEKKPPILDYFLPDRWFVATVISMVVFSQTALMLRAIGLGEDGGINKNISEFREVTVYYIFMIYAFELVYKRSFSPDSSLFNAQSVPRSCGHSPAPRVSTPSHRAIENAPPR